MAKSIDWALPGIAAYLGPSPITATDTLRLMQACGYLFARQGGRLPLWYGLWETSSTAFTQTNESGGADLTRREGLVTPARVLSAGEYHIEARAHVRAGEVRLHLYEPTKGTPAGSWLLTPTGVSAQWVTEHITLSATTPFAVWCEARTIDASFVGQLRQLDVMARVLGSADAGVMP